MINQINFTLISLQFFLVIIFVFFKNYRGFDKATSGKYYTVHVQIIIDREALFEILSSRSKTNKVFESKYKKIKRKTHSHKIYNKLSVPF